MIHKPWHNTTKLSNEYSLEALIRSIFFLKKVLSTSLKKEIKSLDFNFNHFMAMIELFTT